MPRRPSKVLRKELKLSMDAALLGRMELRLFNPTLGKPIYAARSRLFEALLKRWLAEEAGDALIPSIPTLEELRDFSE